MTTLHNNLVQLLYCFIIKKRYIIDNILVFKFVFLVTKPALNAHVLAEKSIVISNMVKFIIADILTETHLRQNKYLPQIHTRTPGAFLTFCDFCFQYFKYFFVPLWIGEDFFQCC